MPKYANKIDEDKKAKKKKRALLLLLLLLFISLGTFLLHYFGFFRFPWEKTPVAAVISGDLFPGSNAEDGALPNLTAEELLEYMQKAADASAFSYRLNARPTFANGTAEGNWEIVNPQYNIYPFVVQVTLDDTGEMVYDSGGLLPDQHIEKGKLLKSLKAGTYNATATIHMYNPEDNRAVGKTQAGLVITVLE